MGIRVIDYAVGARTTLANERATRAERYTMAVAKLSHMLAGEIRSKVHSETVSSPHKGRTPYGEETDYRVDLFVFTPEELNAYVVEQCEISHRAQMTNIVNMIKTVAGL